MTTTATHAHSHVTPRSRARTSVIIGALIGGAAALGAGAVLLVDAIFTSDATVSGHSVTTGTIEIQAGTSATSAPITTDTMMPGDEITTEILIENTGTGDFFYTVALPYAPDATSLSEDLAEALEVTVIVDDDVLQQPLATWQEGHLQVGPPLAVGEDVPIVVSVRFPEDAGNELQDTRAAFAVQIDAIQAKNIDPPSAGWVVE